MQVYRFLALPSSTQYRVADTFGYRFTRRSAFKALVWQAIRLELDSAVCRAIERGMLTPRLDFGKATDGPSGHSKRARHRGTWPHRHYAIARLNQHSTGIEAIASAEIRPGEWKQTGPSRRVR